MHGREVLQPVDVMLGTAEANLSNLFPHEYVNHLAHTLPQLYELVQTNLQSTQARQKRDYDVRIKESSYDVGDLVYLLDSATNIGRSKKLRSSWKGPYLIVKVLSNILLRIRGQRGDFTMIACVSCVYDLNTGVPICFVCTIWVLGSPFVMCVWSEYWSPHFLCVYDLSTGVHIWLVCMIWILRSSFVLCVWSEYWGPHLFCVYNLSTGVPICHVCMISILKSPFVLCV